MSLLTIRADVAVAMRAAVLRTGVFDQNTYSEAIIPEKQPWDGFGANESGWDRVLADCGKRLKKKGYPWKTPPRPFVQRTLSIPLADTNNELADALHGGVPVS
jgi:hypothetical protein